MGLVGLAPPTKCICSRLGLRAGFCPLHFNSRPGPGPSSSLASLPSSRYCPGPIAPGPRPLVSSLWFPELEEPYSPTLEFPYFRHGKPARGGLASPELGHHACYRRTAQLSHAALPLSRQGRTPLSDPGDTQRPALRKAAGSLLPAGFQGQCAPLFSEEKKNNLFMREVLAERFIR